MKVDLVLVVTFRYSHKLYVLGCDGGRCIKVRAYARRRKRSS